MESFTFTPNAGKQIAEMAAAEGALALRVAVNGGGCSGFQYEFTLVKAPEDDDVLIDAHGAKVLIDPTSLDLLKGSQLDYINELSGSYFSVSNPNATSSCGCGNSFSL